MDIESAPRRFTKEGPFQTIGRRARNPPKKTKSGPPPRYTGPPGSKRPARTPPPRPRPRGRSHAPPLAREPTRHKTRDPTLKNAAIKGKIDEVLVKLPEPARKKLEEIEKTTGQPKSLLAGGGALFGLFLVFFLCPPQLVFSAVGVGYPTYASLKMLAEDKTEDAAMWITYWCLFSLLKVVMNPLDFILGFLPFYFYLKLVLLVWLFSPTTKGAGVVYEKVVKPFVFPLLVGSKSD